MRRITVLVLAVAFAVSLGAHTASAASQGVWLSTRSDVAAKLPARFHDIASVSCKPDTTSATDVFSQVRYWNRFWWSNDQNLWMVLGGVT
jgi:hypothetical protein